MKNHQQIDRRSLQMVRKVVAKIDADPERRGLEHAKRVCGQWVARGNVPAREWMSILTLPWEEVRSVLLDDSEEGQRLRQSDPFCGVLTPEERWTIYREAEADDAEELEHVLRAAGAPEMVVVSPEAALFTPS